MTNFGTNNCLPIIYSYAETFNVKYSVILIGTDNTINIILLNFKLNLRFLVKI